MHPGLIAVVATVAAGTAWLLVKKKIQQIWSPNFSDHTTGPWRGVVLHYTAGGSYKGTVQWFLNPAAKVSTHFVIGRHGEIVQMVPLDKNAWHTGETFSVETSNRYLVGIEIANHGRLVEKDGKLYYKTGGKESNEIRPFAGEAEKASLTHSDGSTVVAYWEKYPMVQMAALVWLLGELRLQGVPLNLWGHEDICKPVGRKNDPGPLFPWHLMPGNRVKPATRSQKL